MGVEGGRGGHLGGRGSVYSEIYCKYAPTISVATEILLGGNLSDNNNPVNYVPRFIQKHVPVFALSVVLA